MTRARRSGGILEAAVREASTQRFELYLFIAGTTPRSLAALVNVTAVCEERLRGRYDLVVVDVYQQPARARDAQIIAVPTLLKKSPVPQRRMIGDLSNRARLLVGLDLAPDRGDRDDGR